MKSEILSIFSRIKAENPGSIAILCQKLQPRTEWEDGEKFTRYKVADNVSLLESILLKEGIHFVSPITSKCTTCDHFKVHHFGWGFSDGWSGCLARSEWILW